MGSLTCRQPNKVLSFFFFFLFLFQTKCPPRTHNKYEQQRICKSNVKVKQHVETFEESRCCLDLVYFPGGSVCFFFFFS